jgi:hypothetical protein
MDKIIDKLIKKLPLGIVIGCLMVDYKIIPAIFIPEFDNDDSIIHDIRLVFNRCSYSRITEGTIISSDTKIRTNKGMYQIEHISDILGYPCSMTEGKEGFKVDINVCYENDTDTVLTMYCNRLDCEIKNFTDSISKFITKMDQKMNKHISIETVVDRYFSLGMLKRMVNDNVKLNNDHKRCIEDKLEKYEYGLILSLHNRGAINMYTAKIKILLLLLIRLCELEEANKFNPSDMKIKSDIIINKLSGVYKVTKNDKKLAIVDYSIII